MRYKSNKPTKEKKKLYNFMERHKKGGVVSSRKAAKYMKENSFNVKYMGSSITASSGYGKKSRMYWYDLKNKKGKKIAEFGLKNKKRPRIVWWNIR